MTGQDEAMTGKLLTVAQVAKLLNTSERFPRRLIAERRIEFVRVGRHVRISEAALAAYVQSGVVKPVNLRGYPEGRQ